MLPKAKITPEIAAARGVPMGVDCISPAAHSAFSTPAGLMHFVAQLRELSGGKPTGFKLCIGHPWEWFAIAKAMLETGVTPDFIVVDGAEGGTGAAPVEFTDHVGTPLQEGLRLVHNTLVGVGLRDRIKLGCAGKVTNSFDIARMLALGADWCNSGRAFMMAVGCLQAQTCHTGRCPTGVTTQDPLRQRALVVGDKAPRVAQYHANTLHALKELLQAAGLKHTDEVTTHHIVRRIDDAEVRLLSSLMPQVARGAILDDLAHLPNVFRLYWPLASAHSFAPQQPATDAAPPDLRDPAARRKSNAPASASEVAQQLREVCAAAQPHPASVEPQQAPEPVAAPPSPSEVPVTWTASDTHNAQR